MVFESPSCSLQSIVTTECVISPLNFLRSKGKSLRTRLLLLRGEGTMSQQLDSSASAAPPPAHSGQVHRRQESPGCEPQQVPLWPPRLCLRRGENGRPEKWARVVTDRIWTQRHIIHCKKECIPGKQKNNSQFIHLYYGENRLYKL